MDPEAPQIAMFELKGDELDLVAHAVGNDEVTIDEPFRVWLRPSALR